MANTYDLNFDFRSPEQRAILDELQQATPPYTLLGYLAAFGTGQLPEGVPVWFARSFADLFGNVTIEYSPDYQLYACTSYGTGTNITMDVAVAAGLGTSWIFNPDGSFEAGSRKATAESVLVVNNSPNKVVMGLAAKDGGVYKPFCAFQATSQGALEMTPRRSACLFVAQLNVQSGAVTAAVAAPGAQFTLGDQLEYNFTVEPKTYQITGIGNTSTKVVPPGYELAMLLQ